MLPGAALAGVAGTSAAVCADAAAAGGDAAIAGTGHVGTLQFASFCRTGWDYLSEYHSAFHHGWGKIQKA